MSLPKGWSVTSVRWAVVWPVTPRAMRPASRTATFSPASFRIPAAVMPVIPDPTMATSTRGRRAAGDTRARARWRSTATATAGGGGAARLRAGLSSAHPAHVILRALPPVTAEQIGPYRIVQRLGAGGMGEVFLADDTRLGRKVALKTLSASGDAQPAQTRRKLLREARAAARLNHPNIAAVYDVVEFGDEAHIVMEYVPGETLAKRLAAGPLPAAAVVELGGADRGRARGGPRRGGRPPRPEAREHRHGPGRQAQDPRLRPRPQPHPRPQRVHGPAVRRRARRAPRRGGHAALHAARAAARPFPRRARRHLQPRGDAVRAAHRPAPVRRRRHRRGGHERAARADAAGARPPPRSAPRPRRRGRARDGAPARGPLRVRGRAARRPPARRQPTAPTRRPTPCSPGG